MLYSTHVVVQPIEEMTFIPVLDELEFHPDVVAEFTLSHSDLTELFEEGAAFLWHTPVAVAEYVGPLLGRSFVVSSTIHNSSGGDLFRMLPHTFLHVIRWTRRSRGAELSFQLLNLGRRLCFSFARGDLERRRRLSLPRLRTGLLLDG